MKPAMTPGEAFYLHRTEWTRRGVEWSLLIPNTKEMFERDAERILENAAAIRERMEDGWQPIETAPEVPGTYINVRSVTSYRWLEYKKDGQRQMRARGRWQRATEWGWENCSKPDGEWMPNPPSVPEPPK